MEELKIIQKELKKGLVIEAYVERRIKELEDVLQGKQKVQSRR